jgi:hypothetical protein
MRPHGARDLKPLFGLFPLISFSRWWGVRLPGGLSSSLRRCCPLVAALAARSSPSWPPARRRGRLLAAAHEGGLEKE